MTATRSGIAVTGERRAHAFDAGLVEIWGARCVAGSSGDYVSDDPRLFIILDPLAAAIELDDGDAPSRATLPCASFVPAGTRVRMRCDGATAIRHLDLHFEARLLPEGRDGGPRLMFADPRVERLAALLDAACGSAEPSRALYRESLVTALLAAAFRPGEATCRTPLCPRRLCAVVDYIEDHCAEAIPLRRLAALAGLSETYFSHAFKAATGQPPHRWQLQARVRKAQMMLEANDASLTQVAAATGFADQPHFTRVFRAATGETPAAWRAARRRRA